ncbi:complement factor B-like [Symphorus nematophorus]
MGFSVHWSWLAALSCLLCMGGEVRCDCTEANMQIEGGDYKLTKQLRIGSLLIYNCPEGYYPYPALTRVCQPNGTWKPAPRRFTPQRCRMVECPDPNVLEYGNVSPPQEKYFVDNETTYECYSGYTMRGSSRRVCLPNGKWSGSTPICSRDSGDNCADPGIPAGASREGQMFGIDDTVKYSCNHNLFLVGSSERVCQEDGHWTGKEPACYYKHTYDTSLEVSEAFGSAIKDSLTTLESVDDIQGERKIRVPKNGSLNIYIAMDISESIDPLEVEKAKNATTKLIRKISSFSVNPNYEILFFSAQIYEIVNIVDFFIRKTDTSTAESDVKSFKVGDKNTAGTDLNSVFRTIEERMGVIKQRVGEQAFKEHRHVLIIFTDGAYNMGGSPAPTVKRIKNMIYMNHTTEGETNPRDEYLDIYIFGIGAELFDDDLQPLTAGSVGQHYFRMKDIKNLQDTFDEIIVKKVKTFRLHENYNVTAKTKLGVKEFYDYDVALLQLDGDVHISRDVRPICIPCTEETSAALKLGSDSTCVQQGEMLLKTHHERLTFLTRTDNIVDEKDVRAKLGDTRDECIRKALKAPGITTDKPKDAVTDNFLCTGGLTPQRDHIACTGDSGGAVFKNFEHRTIQVALVSWGTKAKCVSGGVVESDEDSRDFHINLFRVVPFLKSVLGDDNQDDFEPLQFLKN